MCANRLGVLATRYKPRHACSTLPIAAIDALPTKSAPSSDRRSDQAFLFETLERVVGAREDDAFAGALLGHTRDRHAVGFVSLADQREEHEKFEVVQRFP
jgi:hypothetical protein